MSTHRGTYENKKGEIRRMRFAQQGIPYDTKNVRGFLQFASVAKDHFQGYDDLRGAEIGAHLGESALMLNSVVPFKEYSLYDLWKNERCREICRNNVGPLGIKQFKMSGEDGSKLHEDGSLDFVYLDALHYHKDVVNDIRCWLPKVKRGGIIAGHDYIKSERLKWGVIEAVAEELPDKEVKVFDDTTWMVIV